MTRSGLRSCDRRVKRDWQDHGEKTSERRVNDRGSGGQQAGECFVRRGRDVEDERSGTGRAETLQLSHQAESRRVEFLLV